MDFNSNLPVRIKELHYHNPFLNNLNFEVRESIRNNHLSYIQQQSIIEYCILKSITKYHDALVLLSRHLHFNIYSNKELLLIENFLYDIYFQILYYFEYMYGNIHNIKRLKKCITIFNKKIYPFHFDCNIDIHNGNYHTYCVYILQTIDKLILNAPLYRNDLFVYIFVPNSPESIHYSHYLLAGLTPYQINVDFKHIIRLNIKNIPFLYLHSFINYYGFKDELMLPKTILLSYVYSRAIQHLYCDLSNLYTETQYVNTYKQTLVLKSKKEIIFTSINSHLYTFRITVPNMRKIHPRSIFHKMMRCFCC